MYTKKIAVGTVQFGLTYGIANKIGKIDFNRGNEIIQFASSIGIDTLDTAIAYGESEQLLGEIGVNDWKIITKLPPLENIYESSDIQSSLREYLRLSLKNLKVSKVYGLLLHNPDDLLSNKGDLIYKALKSLQGEGYFEKFGISIYDADKLESYTSNFDINIVQCPFNFLDRRIEKNGWMEKLKQKQIEIHSRSLFLQGLLLMNRDEIPQKFSRWNDIWQEIETFKQEKKISSLDICISFIKKYPSIDKIIIGIDHKDHLLEIINSFNKPALEIPEIEIDDQNLINPSRWESL